MHFVQRGAREVPKGIYPFFGSDGSFIVSIVLWSDELICGFDHASMIMHVNCIHSLMKCINHSRT
jgi:hypothetical protein